MLVVAGITISATFIDNTGTTGGPGFALALAVAAVAPAALLWRRTHPIEITTITLAAGLAPQLLKPYINWPVAAIVAVATLAARRPPRVSLWGLAALGGARFLSRCPRLAPAGRPVCMLAARSTSASASADRFLAR